MRKRTYLAAIAIGALALLWLLFGTILFPPPPVKSFTDRRVLDSIYGCYRHDGRLLLILSSDGTARALGPPVRFSVLEIRGNPVIRPEKQLAAVRLADGSYIIRVVDGHPPYLDVTLGSPPKLTVMSLDHSWNLILEKGNCPS